MVVVFSSGMAWATSNHEYGSNEYDTVINGISPNGKYAVTTHGSIGNLGYDDFRVFLTDARSGKAINSLKTIADNLDTGADAFAANWSTDSKSFYVVYRISRHEPLQVGAYRIVHGHADPSTFTHVNATGEQVSYWGENCSIVDKPSPKIFGAPKLKKPASE
jgi:hypothetical protein